MRAAATVLMSVMATAAVAIAHQGIAPPPPQTPPQAPKPVPPLKAGAAVILGKVVEAGGNTGVANAIVFLTGEALGAPTAVFTDGTPGGRRQSMTDSDGQFIFRNLPPGSYNLDSDAAGFVDASYGDTRPAQPTRLLDLKRSLEILESDRSVPVKLQMWRLGGIGGTVRDDLGEPLVGATVAILSRAANPAGPTLRRVLFLPTDDRGMFHADVPPDDYLVGVFGATSTIPNWAVEVMQEAVAEGAGPAAKTYQTQILAGGFPVTGTGMRIGAFTLSRRDLMSATPLPPVYWMNGRLMQFPTTYYPASRTAAGAGVIKVQSGSEVPAIDIQVPLIEARRVSGTVSGPNGPVAAIAMLLIPSDPALATSSPAPILDTPQTMADGNGNFTFIGVPPGSYTLRAAMPEATTALQWSLQQVVVPGDADLTDVRVTLREGLKVSGRIAVDPAATKTATPEQLKAITVSLRTLPGSNGALLGSLLKTNNTRPDPDHFVTATSVPGAHLINVTGAPAGWIVKSAVSAGQDVIDKPLDLTGNLADVVVTITDRISSLAGVVRDDDGKVNSTSTVIVFPADRSLWPPVSMSSRRIRTAALSRDGRYSVRGLPAGEYVVAAVETTADLSDPGVLASLMVNSARVTLSDGDTRSQDLRVVKR